MLKILLPMVMALLLTGCLTPQPEPEPIPVEVAPEPEPAPPAPNLELLRVTSQINALKEEIKSLRGAVEQMQFAQGNADRRSQDQLQDIDRRLLSLEQFDQEILVQVQNQSSRASLSPSAQILAEGQLDTKNAIAEGATPSLQSENTNGVEPSTGGTNSVVVVESAASSTATDPTTPAVDLSAEGGSVSLNEQDAFDNAISEMNQGRYQDAIDQFEALVTTWPRSDLADDALYYMSEAYLVNREFELALNGFRGVIQRYPSSARVPKSMLRVGTIQYDIGAYKEAAETLQTVLERFPGNEVTVQAQTRLRRIQQTIGE